MSWPSMLCRWKQDVRRCRECGQRWSGDAFWSAAAGCHFCGRNGGEQLGCALFFWRVIPFAGQHLVVVVGHFDFDLAKFSVMRRVRRIVAERVLAAQLFGNLIEGLG